MNSFRYSDGLKRRLSRMFPLVTLVGVVGITLRVYWNLAKGSDLLVVGDESLYLTLGSRFLHESVLPTFAWSPLYACWYAADLRVFSDPVVAYYAQMHVVNILTAALMCLYLQAVRVPKSFCVLGAILWIAQPAYVSLDFGLGYPRPYHFAFLIFLAGALVLHKLNFRRRIPLLLTALAFMLPVIAVRQEYLGALISMILILDRSWILKYATSSGCRSCCCDTRPFLPMRRLKRSRLA